MGDLAAAEKVGAGRRALDVLSWVVGAVVGRYSGINLMIPLFASAAVWWLGNKLLSDHRKVVVPALSINAGHFLWLAVGMAYMGGLSFNLLDLGIYAAGLFWLARRPSAGPLYLLGAYQAFALLANTASLASADVGTVAHKALLVHVIWRVLALFFMVKLFVALRRQESEAVAAVAN